MIEKDEIILISRKLNLDPSIIEKDYVLGWILNGINHEPETQNAWIFKGGTSLKKCYFDDYRFSEDLDFTIIENHADVSKWRVLISRISDWVNAQSSIEIPNKFIDVDIYKNPQNHNMIQASVRFNGPLRRKTNFPRIKLDLSPNEKVILKPEKLPIYHSYSDSLIPEAVANCYPFDEIFAEKIRALVERARPRDLYDVVHLFRSKNRIKSKKQLLEILSEKCRHKQISLPELKAVHSHPQNIIPKEWNNMLKHQLPHLEPYEVYYAELPKIFDWLYSSNEE